jgi:LmbE family N-acetylglucosaminyl deacetylase
MLCPNWIADTTASPQDVGGVAVVVAHPDDETIGCGALLTRLPRAQIVLVTSGSPEDAAIAQRKGFGSRQSYAVARGKELRAALKIGGIEEHRLHTLDFVDGKVWRDWQSIAFQLARFFEANRISTVLTHAYEGGHSDHDGVAHCVHAASELLAGDAPLIIEMPYYHDRLSGRAYQMFRNGEPGIVSKLTATQAALKRQMLGAYATQARTLAWFDPRIERFRMARRPDPHVAPINGDSRLEASAACAWK